MPSSVMFMIRTRRSLNTSYPKASHMRRIWRFSP
ncbi:Uncharacterised protein [Vibrio cholerae]|nr:Uncharacterised protein [Vibrio cholerae]CSI55656.1 Uncharacterised protein [Vibrio cholerae]